jgi:hypothetical protein
MELAAFDRNSSTNGMQKRGWEPPPIQVDDPREMDRAVADLLQNKFLTHTFGVQGEWEVRTTIVANRQAWRYQSKVFVQGKEARRDFSPIDVDQTRQKKQHETVTEELLAAFAREAVEVHIARCTSVAEYAVMASIFSQPLPRSRGLTRVALVLLSVTALLTAYWWWKGFTSPEPEQPDRQPPSHSVQWQTLQVSYHAPAGEPFAIALPALTGVPAGTPVDITLDSSGDEPSWLQLDGERFHLRGTAPLTTEDQTYRLIVRAQAAPGSDSRLVFLLTIRGQPDQLAPAPQLPGHWSW